MQETRILGRKECHLRNVLKSSEKTFCSCTSYGENQVSPRQKKKKNTNKERTLIRVKYPERMDHIDGIDWGTQGIYIFSYFFFKL